MTRTSFTLCLASLLTMTSLSASANMFNEKPSGAPTGATAPQQFATPSPTMQRPTGPSGLSQRPMMPPAFTPSTSMPSGALPGSSPYPSGSPVVSTFGATSPAPVPAAPVKEQFDMDATPVYKGRINGVHLFKSSDGSAYDTRKASKVTLVRSLRTVPAPIVAQGGTPAGTVAPQPVPALPSAVGRPSPSLPIMANPSPAPTLPSATATPSAGPSSATK